MKSRPADKSAEGSNRVPTLQDQQLLTLLDESYGTTNVDGGDASYIASGSWLPESERAFEQRLAHLAQQHNFKTTMLTDKQVLQLEHELSEQQELRSSQPATSYNRLSKPFKTAEVSDVRYENIAIHNATQWSIWIGPQQAIYSGACSLLWPWVPGTSH